MKLETVFHQWKNAINKEPNGYSNGKVYYRSGIPSLSNMKEREAWQRRLCKMTTFEKERLIYGGKK